MIRFYLSLVRSVAYGKSEVKLFACKEIINRWYFSLSKSEKWFNKLLNVKQLPLFHHFKAIYQFPKHIIFLVKIIANAPLSVNLDSLSCSFTSISFLTNVGVCILITQQNASNDKERKLIQVLQNDQLFVSHIWHT